MEKRELEEKIKLLQARTEEIKAARMDEEYYGKIISAIKSYQGVSYEPGNQNLQ